MRIFAIGDVHLPGGPRNKPMDRFGDIWRDHTRVIKDAWEAQARGDDVLLIAGDLSWGMTADDVVDDLRWIRELTGTKVAIRGNHDFWWSGIGKVRAALGPTVHALQQDHVVLGDVAIVGTRGWQCPGDVGSADFMTAPGEKDAGSKTYTENDRVIYEREVLRLKLGLEGLERSRLPHRTRVVMLHYPPMNARHEASGFTDLLDLHGVDLVVHGHLHGPASIATAFEGTRGKTRYHCVSADAVAMRPRLVYDDGVLP